MTDEEMAAMIDADLAEIRKRIAECVVCLDARQRRRESGRALRTLLARCAAAGDTDNSCDLCTAAEDQHARVSVREITTIGLNHKQGHRTVTANHLTDQILAAFAETERDNPPPPWTAAMMHDIGSTLTRVLPELEPAVIGQVLMHTGAVFNSIAGDSTLPFREAATFGANVLIGTGGRLHGTETTITLQAANPITDQMAAAAHTITANHRPDCQCPITETPAGIIADMTEIFPDVDPRLLGAIMLHTNAIAQGLAIEFEKDDNTADSEVAPSALNLVLIAAADLYTGK